MATWPTSVPHTPLRDSYQMQPDDNRIVFKPESGPPKRRLRSTARSYLHQISLMLTSTESDTLEEFYEETLGDGVLPFDFPEDPRRGDECVMTFESVIQWRATGQFSEGEQVWQASFTLRRMP